MQVTIIFLVASALLSCSDSTRCPPALFLQKDEWSYALKPKELFNAPIIVVGTVDAVKSLAPPYRVRDLPGALIECTELSLQVELVLRGQINSRTIEVVQHVFSSRSERDLGTRFYSPVIGERRMFFLRPEFGLLRPLGDVRDYTIKIASGHHSPEAIEGREFGDKVAYILLTPGEGYDEDELAVSLPNSALVSDTLNNELTTDLYLQQLRPRVGGGAKKALEEIMKDRSWWRERR